MNRLANWMMQLYPARWRRRYGDELDALLADTGADARTIADLFRGGVRMQFSTWSVAKLAAVLGIGGLLLGAAGSFLIAPMYVSKATLRMEALTEVLPQVEPRVLSRTSLSGIVNDWGSPLYMQDLKVMPIVMSTCSTVCARTSGLNQSQRPAREIARRILQFRFGIPTPQRRSTPSLRSLTGSKKNPRY